MTALTEPLIFLAGRPAAERAADARGFGLAYLLVVFKFAIWSDDWIVRNRIHDRYYELDPDPQRPSAPSNKHGNKALTPI